MTKKLILLPLLLSAAVVLANTPGVHTVLLSWAAPTSGAPTTYNIYRSASATVCPAGQQITPYASVAGDKTSFTDTNTPAGTYNYAVTAVGNGESACTTPVQVLVPAINQGTPSNANAIVQ